MVKEQGIVNTFNAVVMASMKIADDYMNMRERFEKVEDKTLRLLRKVRMLRFPAVCVINGKLRTNTSLRGAFYVAECMLAFERDA